MGLHSRLIGQILLLAVSFLGIRQFKVSLTTIITASVIFLYVILILFHSQGEHQLDYLFSLIVDKNNYYASKLSIFIQVTLVPLVAGFILSNKARDRRFLEGMVYASLAMSVFAILIGVKYSEYWFTSSYQAVVDRKDEALFSSISMTILHLAGFISAIECIKLKKLKVCFFGFALTNFIFIVIYQQRTAWVYMILVLTYVFLSGNKGLKVGFRLLRFFTAMLLVVMVVMAMLYAGILNERIVNYAMQMNSMDLFSSRSGYFDFALTGFFEHPFGNGWGSYSINGPFIYPHNVVLESLYELGVIGGVLIVVLLIMMLLSIRGLLRDKCSIIFGINSSVAVGLLFGYLVFFSQKAGDINSLNIPLSLLLLLSTYFWAKKT